MTKLAPARNVGSIVISDSYAACASTVWLEFRPPPERKGIPNERAIWPVASRPMADSGVPKLGEPDFMSVLERNEPKTTGQPGFTSWVSAMPESASAICRSEEHTSELQSRGHLVCRLLLEKKNPP